MSVYIHTLGLPGFSLAAVKCFCQYTLFVTVPFNCSKWISPYTGFARVYFRCSECFYPYALPFRARFRVRATDIVFGIFVALSCCTLCPLRFILAEVNIYVLTLCLSRFIELFCPYTLLITVHRAFLHLHSVCHGSVSVSDESTE